MYASGPQTINLGQVTEGTPGAPTPIDIAALAADAGAAPWKGRLLLAVDGNANIDFGIRVSYADGPDEYVHVGPGPSVVQCQRRVTLAQLDTILLEDVVVATNNAINVYLQLDEIGLDLEAGALTGPRTIHDDATGGTLAGATALNTIEVVEGVQDIVPFVEDGVDLSFAITPGQYADLDALCAQIQTDLLAAGANTYTCAQVAGTVTFTRTVGALAFGFRWVDDGGAPAVPTARSAGARLGFTANDASGAGPFASDVAVDPNDSLCTPAEAGYVVVVVTGNDTLDFGTGGITLTKQGAPTALNMDPIVADNGELAAGKARVVVLLGPLVASERFGLASGAAASGDFDAVQVYFLPTAWAGVRQPSVAEYVEQLIADLRPGLDFGPLPLRSIFAGATLHREFGDYLRRSFDPPSGSTFGDLDQIVELAIAAGESAATCMDSIRAAGFTREAAFSWEEFSSRYATATLRSFDPNGLATGTEFAACATAIKGYLAALAVRSTPAWGSMEARIQQFLYDVMQSAPLRVLPITEHQFGHYGWRGTGVSRGVSGDTRLFDLQANGTVPVNLADAAAGNEEISGNEVELKVGHAAFARLVGADAPGAAISIDFEVEFEGVAISASPVTAVVTEAGVVIGSSEIYDKVVSFEPTDAAVGNDAVGLVIEALKAPDADTGNWPAAV